MKKVGLIAGLCFALSCLAIFPTVFAGSGTVTQGMRRRDSAIRAGVVDCYITDTAGNVVTDVSISSIFGNDHQMYYQWFVPSLQSFNQKFILKFDSDGFGLASQTQKINYNLAANDDIALAFSMTPENTSLGQAKYKVKTDAETCVYFFNVVP